MLIHMFAFRWSSSATEAHKERAIEEILAFQGVIPGLLEVHIGKNQSPRGGAYETGGVMKFADAGSLNGFGPHPAHQALLGWLPPLLIEPVEVDFVGTSD
jgi:hypothetical protein